MGTPAQFDQDVFRILLYRNDVTELLLEGALDRLRLPAVSVPVHTRVAEKVTAAIKSSWNLETYCLLTLPSGTLSEDCTRYAVLEAPRHEPTPPGMQWLPVSSCSVGSFQDPADFAAIENALTTLDRHRRGELPGLFGKPGWFRVVRRWVESQTSCTGHRLTGRFRQFNASSTFSLLRFETTGPAVWFKAVGEPNVREFRVTRELARLFPGFVPRVLAVRLEWNAWLTVEVAGSHLDGNSNLHQWTAVATALAELQLVSRGRTLHLIDAGCRDVRVCSLAELVEPFLRAMAELMERQTKQSPAPLSRTELLVLRTKLQDLFSEIADSAIPNAIGHLDFNPGNIIASRDRCVFLDWAEACVGHPFLTFQYLLEHLRRFRPQDGSWESALTSAYAERWRDCASPGEIAHALAISPLLAVFAYATSGDPWRDPTLPSQPEIARHLRSLTRRINREAGSITERQAPCVS